MISHFTTILKTQKVTCFIIDIVENEVSFYLYIMVCHSEGHKSVLTTTQD